MRPKEHQEANKHTALNIINMVRRMVYCKYHWSVCLPLNLIIRTILKNKSETNTKVYPG
jgi:hypothetical protein